jgi:hypothetical protein
MRKRYESASVSTRALLGPLFFYTLSHVPSEHGWHLNRMVLTMNSFYVQEFRMPAEPQPFPIQEPPDPPENPDMPVREPDPEDPGQI